MTTGRMLGALLLVVGAVILQTTLFVSTRPFGAAPDLIVLAVFGLLRFMPAEPGIFLGFTGGLLADLLGGSPLGMWALSLTVVAYLVIRLRDRAQDSYGLAIVGVFAFTFVAQSLYVLLGTLFGQQPLKDPGVARIVILTALFTAVLAMAVLPVGSWLARETRGRRSRVLV
ncbi:MAG: rod shape-determining protein MreD [Acidimicrobiia bacterium]|nr:rod shape-determining protein MreD [Acidimicrobiia bacterium]